MTHGSKSKRQHGSIGSSATPSRVFPGLKMAGQMGNERKTIKALEVIAHFGILDESTCLALIVRSQTNASVEKLLYIP